MTVIPDLLQHGKEFVLQHERNQWNDAATIGEMLAGVTTYFILEDPLTSKTPPFTADKYPLRLAESPRLKCLPPEKLARLENDPTVIWIDNVPGHSALQIHPGYDQDDTDGCQLPGCTADAAHVYQSTKAFLAIRALLREAIKKGQTIWINITEKNRPEQGKRGNI